jgi:hypothetical protein
MGRRKMQIREQQWRSEKGKTGKKKEEEEGGGRNWKSGWTATALRERRLGELGDVETFAEVHDEDTLVVRATARGGSGDGENQWDGQRRKEEKGMEGRHT